MLRSQPTVSSWNEVEGCMLSQTSGDRTSGTHEAKAPWRLFPSGGHLALCCQVKTSASRLLGAAHPFFQAENLSLTRVAGPTCADNPETELGRGSSNVPQSLIGHGQCLKPCCPNGSAPADQGGAVGRRPATLEIPPGAGLTVFAGNPFRVAQEAPVHRIPSLSGDGVRPYPLSGHVCRKRQVELS